MSSDDEDSGIRGRIDRFFDKRAKEQQELLRGEIGGKKISDSWKEAKQRMGRPSKNTKKSSKKVHEVKKSKSKALDSEDDVGKPEVEISLSLIHI